MTNSETLVREPAVTTRLGWLHSRNRLSNRLDDMFGVAARIDHQVRAAFTSQVKAARTPSSFDDHPYRYSVGWTIELDETGTAFGVVSVCDEPIAGCPGAEVIRFRLATPMALELAGFGDPTADDRHFLLTRDLYTMDRWTLCLEAPGFTLEIRFLYER